jgi:hypothetical protein
MQVSSQQEGESQLGDVVAKHCRQSIHSRRGRMHNCVRTRVISLWEIEIGLSPARILLV